MRIKKPVALLLALALLLCGCGAPEVPAPPPLNRTASSASEMMTSASPPSRLYFTALSQRLYTISSSSSYTPFTVT